MFKPENIVKELQRAIDKDPEKADLLFSGIYREYAGLVRYLARQITGSDEDSKDITQDVFLKLFDTIRNGTDIVNLKYWLVRTSKNTALNLKAKNKRVSGEDNYNFDALPARKTEIPEMISEIKKILTPEEADIVILHLVYNLSFREIGSEYNRTGDAVGSQYRRAIKKLKKIK